MVHEEEARQVPESLRPGPVAPPPTAYAQEIQARVRTPEVTVPRTERERTPERIDIRALRTELSSSDVPTRTRSPVPKRRPPPAELAPRPEIRKEDAWVVTPRPDPEPAVATSSPPVTQLTRSSRSRSAGHRRRTRNPRPRLEEDSDCAAQEFVQQDVPPVTLSDNELLPPVVAPPPLIMDSPATRCITPPPRNESLQNGVSQRQYAPSPEPRRVDRLPHNGSQRHLPTGSPQQKQLDESYQPSDSLASPSLATRSLSPTRQSQSTLRHAKTKPHGQHRHAPTAEVTQVRSVI